MLEEASSQQQLTSICVWCCLIPSMHDLSYRESLPKRKLGSNNDESDHDHAKKVSIIHSLVCCPFTILPLSIFVFNSLKKMMKDDFMSWIQEDQFKVLLLLFSVVRSGFD